MINETLMNNTERVSPNVTEKGIQYASKVGDQIVLHYPMLAEAAQYVTTTLGAGDPKRLLAIIKKEMAYNGLYRLDIDVNPADPARVLIHARRRRVEQFS